MVFAWTGGSVVNCCMVKMLSKHSHGFAALKTSFVKVFSPYMARLSRNTHKSTRTE